MLKIFLEIKLFLEFIYYRSYVFYSSFRCELWPEISAWHVVSLCLMINIISIIILIEIALKANIIPIAYMWPLAIVHCFFCYKWLLASIRKDKKSNPKFFKTLRSERYEGKWYNNHFSLWIVISYIALSLITVIIIASWARYLKGFS